MTIEELKNKAYEELKNNDELFVDMVNELDGWNGYADGFRAYPMSELDDLFYGCSLSEFLGKITKTFNLNDEYMVDTIYGLDSTDDITTLYRDNVYEDELLEGIIENANHLWFSDSDFENLINEIVNFEDEELAA